MNRTAIYCGGEARGRWRLPATSHPCKGKCGTNSGKSSGLSGKFALGNSRESSDFPEGKSDDSRKFGGQIFQTTLRTFHCFSDFRIKKVKILRPRLPLG